MLCCHFQHNPTRLSAVTEAIWAAAALYCRSAPASDKSDLTLTTCCTMWRNLSAFVSQETRFFMYINFHCKKLRASAELWLMFLILTPQEIIQSTVSVACYSKPSSVPPCVSNSNHSTGHKPDITNHFQTLKLLWERATSTWGKN